MTGAELVEWIREHRAEEMEVLYLQEDGIVTEIRSPEVLDNMDIKAEYWEARFLPEDGRSVIL